MSSVDLHIHVASQDNTQQSMFMHHTLLRCLFREKSVDCLMVRRVNAQYTFQKSRSYVHSIASIESNGTQHNSSQWLKWLRTAYACVINEPFYVPSLSSIVIMWLLNFTTPWSLFLLLWHHASTLYIHVMLLDSPFHSWLLITTTDELFLRVPSFVVVLTACVSLWM